MHLFWKWCFTQTGGFLPELNLQFLLLLITNRYQTGFFFFVFFFLFGQLQQFWYHGSVVVTRGRWEGWHLQLMVSENDEIKSGLERSGNNKHNNYNNNNNTGL